MDGRDDKGKEERNGVRGGGDVEIDEEWWSKRDFCKINDSSLSWYNYHWANDLIGKRGIGEIRFGWAKAKRDEKKKLFNTLPIVYIYVCVYDLSTNVLNEG